MIEPEPIGDERGLFARTFDAETLRVDGAPFAVRQCSTSWNRRAWTLRGLHFQRPPHAEAKVVRCTAGAILDVVVDLRRSSTTYLAVVTAELSATDRRATLVPRGCAHGFMTLLDGSEVLYMMDAPYVTHAADGLRWDDPAIAIDWPADPADVTISTRDRTYPDWRR